MSSTDEIPRLPGRWVIVGLMILTLFPKWFFEDLTPYPSPFAQVIIGPYFLDACLGPITALIVFAIAGGLLFYKSGSWLAGIIYYIAFGFFSILSYVNYIPALQTPPGISPLLQSLWKHGVLLNLLAAVIIVTYLARPLVRETLQFHDPSWSEKITTTN